MVTYLRLSLTDQCNFDCFYCKPSLRPQAAKEDKSLSFAELSALVGLFQQKGLKHLRLTGGEPFLRDDIGLFLKELSLKKIPILSITTNGLLLGDFVPQLKVAGLTSINISLDTLQKSRFKKIAGCEGLGRIKKGITKAVQSGFPHVKINVLLIQGVNDDEVLDFVDFSLEHGVDVRFIEYFATKSSCDSMRLNYVASSDVQKIIEAKHGPLVYLGPDAHCGPAQYFKVKGNASRIGFISSVTDFFCRECNRLRLTPEGSLYPCLHSAYCVDLGGPLREGNLAKVEELLEQVFTNKKFYNKMKCSRDFDMASVGG